MREAPYLEIRGFSDREDQSRLLIELPVTSVWDGFLFAVCAAGCVAESVCRLEFAVVVAGSGEWLDVVCCPGLWVGGFEAWVYPLAA